MYSSESLSIYPANKGLKPLAGLSDTPKSRPSLSIYPANKGLKHLGDSYASMPAGVFIHLSSK